MITRRFLAACTALLLLGSLTGCYRGAIVERESSSDGTPIIAPPEIKTEGGGTSVALFYRYLDEPLLAPLTVELHDRSDRTLEETAVRELLNGPAPTRTELSSLFAPGVTLLEARLTGDELSLTFNSTFTEPPTDMNLPVDWENDPGWEARVALRRRLATYSIVDTVTQMGRVKSVLFKVDEYGDGATDRVRSRHLGLGEDGPSEAVQRDASYIITPQTAAETALECLRERDYGRLERYVAEKGLTGVTRPVREDMANELSQRPQVVNYALSDWYMFVSNDGASAVLDLTITLAGGNAKGQQKNGVPLRLTREREIWKVPYEELEALLN